VRPSLLWGCCGRTLSGAWQISKIRINEIQPYRSDGLLCSLLQGIWVPRTRDDRPLVLGLRRAVGSQGLDPRAASRYLSIHGALAAKDDHNRQARISAQIGLCAASLVCEQATHGWA